MTTALRPSAIVPPGFLVDRVSIDGVTTTIEARERSARQDNAWIAVWLRGAFTAVIRDGSRICRLPGAWSHFPHGAALPLHDSVVSQKHFHRTVRR